MALEFELEMQLELELILQTPFFAVPLGLWIPDLPGWSLRMIGSHPQSHVTLQYVMTWQIKTGMSPLSQEPWSPEFSSVVTKMRGPHPQSHLTHQTSGYRRNKTRYHFQKAYELQTWQGGELGWEHPTHKLTWYINQVVTRQIEKDISPLSQHLWTPNLVVLIMNGSQKSHVTLQFCSQMTIWKRYISSTTSSMALKLIRICT